nr:hypothetical protein [Helicobacter salomonis]
MKNFIPKSLVKPRVLKLYNFGSTSLKSIKTPPNYQAISAKDIPSVSIVEKYGHLRVIAGDYQGAKGPAHTFSPISLWDTTFSSEAIFDVSLPKGHH